jgi:hypothetical protein
LLFSIISPRQLQQQHNMRLLTVSLALLTTSCYLQPSFVCGFGIQKQRQLSRLWSSVATSIPESAEAKDSVAATSMTATKPLRKPVAEGTIVSSFHGGLVAIQIRDGGADDGDDGDRENNKMDQSGSNASDDFVGRQVRFGDGKIVGLVVAQRPPIAFVYYGDDTRLSRNTFILLFIRANQIRQQIIKAVTNKFKGFHHLCKGETVHNKLLYSLRIFVGRSWCSGR